uniref:Uncharacterized protein n=1 Tax=Strigamia maritima TaxID=126957 RepID=T1ILM0_STRMM
MRQVDLRRKGDATSFLTILKNGCGPNFVLNRKKTFIQMIKSQGETFWFRFWLSFCFQPAYDPLECTQRNNRIIQHLWYENIHENVLQVPHETAALFCVDVAVCSLLKTIQLGRLLETSTLKIYDEINLLAAENALESYEKEYMIQPNAYFSMAFGVALCEVFCKWLNAKDVVTNDAASYWVIPSAYLNTKFIPEYLEMYMACKWRDRLFTLLDVSADQVPWLVRLLQEMQIYNFHFDFANQIQMVTFNDTPWEKKMKKRTISFTRHTMEILKEKIQTKDEISYLSQKSMEISSTSRITCIKQNYLIRKFFATKHEEAGKLIK